jgi:hypothetical protein
MVVTVAKICRYPLKGLSAETLPEVELDPGLPLPHDRRFALALGSTPVDGPRIGWLPKTNFLSLVNQEKLAKLRTRFDADGGILTVERGGKQVALGDVTTPVGRAIIEEFFAAFMGEGARGQPKLVEAADGDVLSDHPSAVVSIINLASVKDLERVTGKPINPARFRGNIYLEGLDPWAEFDWLGREIAISGARLEITQRIDRCAATNVDPETAERDLNIPKDLQRGFGNVGLGVYGCVTAAGRVATGDRLVSPD